MSTYLSKRRIRYSFGKISSNVSIPNLIKVQKKSYEEFLQLDISRDNRQKQGLEEVLQSVFQVSDAEGKAKLEYINYDLGEPKYTPEECIQRGVNYASPLKVSLRLILWDCDTELETKEIKGIKEQEVYIGDIPLMTDKGTFIINGAQRVIVSQLHRSPGVFYTHDEGKNSSSGKYIYSARIIPYRGSWIDFEFDTKDILHFRIDRKRKIHVSTLLRAIGYNKNMILEEFYRFIKYEWKNGQLITKLDPNKFRGMKIENDVIDADTGDVIFEKGIRVTPRLLKNFEEASTEKNYIASEDEVKGKFLAKDIVHPKAGEVLHESTQEITQEVIDNITTLGIDEIYILDINNIDSGSFIKDTIVLDKNKDEDQALADIYKVLRPGEPSTPEVAKQLFESMFFDNEKYDLSSVGRMKINKKHDLKTSSDNTALTKDDIVVIVKHLLQLKCGNGGVDDIDSLANRRVRSVGELVENQFRMGLVKMQKSILDRMSSVEIDNVMPHDLVNSKTLMSYLREFFGISQLSQFMDQTNPLAEITHKRRLSALGPGGLTRERAGFEVRDVHTTHYSRICPIETPEGQNIGLISSLATYADIDKYGFIESPYRKVKDGYVTEEIIQLTAIEEERYYISKSSITLDDDERIVDEVVTCHKKGEVVNVPRSKVDLIDVSPQQLVSVAASLIPFLENDDANRALMGSNMQRQSVPLLVPQRPIIGTGLENQIAADSGLTINAIKSGTVDFVSSKKIIVTEKSGRKSEYRLQKYQRSNQETCINQRPIVWKGEQVESGQVLADGPSISGGELALGQNVTVAYMPWQGYNFEDAILINERLVYDDVFTSIHIERYEIEIGVTNEGREQTTKHIPNINPSEVQSLNEDGIVSIGTFVKPGDILVGKVTPKDDSEQLPEAKLLRAIFGAKAKGVRDSSFRMPSGEYGRVIRTIIFRRKNKLAYEFEKIQVFIAQIRKIQVGDKIAGRHGNKGIISRILPRQDMPFLPDGTPVDIILNPLGVPSRMNVGQLYECLLGLAGQKLNRRFKILPFDELYGQEVSRILINKKLREASLESNEAWLFNPYSPGKMILIDGRTGKEFENPITVGNAYMLKLIHLVDDKMHARATGPYSLVTQQPLGGKAQHGGQRFGEMEVWALEGFGAAYTLKELLTIKSDDMQGRNDTLNAIVKGQPIPTSGIPESFKVLLQELRSIGLDISTYRLENFSSNKTCEIEVNLMENYDPMTKTFPPASNINNILF